MVYGFYSFATAAIFLLIFVVNGFRQGWDEYWNLLKKDWWKPTKEGHEDPERGQLSLGGAIEATK